MRSLCFLFFYPIFLIYFFTNTFMDHHELWKTVLGEIELQISRPNFLTWFKNSQLVEKNEKEGIALVGVPNNFAKEWIKNRYHKIILGSLRNIDGSIKYVNYVVVNHNTPLQPPKQSKKQKLA